MKLLFGLTASFVILLLSCSNPGKELPCRSEINYIGDTIIGCFDGKNIDSIYFVPGFTEDCHLNDTLKSTIKGLEHNSITYDAHRSLLVFEGDLDGDGIDEFGFLQKNGFSPWGQYKIYKVIDSQWMELTSFCHINLNDAELEDLASASSEPGMISLKIATYSHDAAAEEWMGWHYQDTIVHATYKEFEHEHH